MLAVSTGPGLGTRSLDSPRIVARCGDILSKSPF